MGSAQDLLGVEWKMEGIDVSGGGGAQIEIFSCD